MSNDETNNEVRHILNDATRREVTLDSGKTIAVYEGTSTRGEMGKIAPWNQVNADAKRWRTQVLSFYGKAATFINDDGIINQIHGCAGETEYTTFDKLFTKSLKRHGWLKSGKPPVHSYTEDGVAFIDEQPKFDGGEK